MLLKNLISSYKTIIETDGLISKEELIDMLKPDSDLDNKYKKDEFLDKIADKILRNIQETQNRAGVTRRLKDSTNDRRLELYNQGLTDGEIADIEKVASTTIWYWRKQSGNLPTNPTVNERMNNRRMELYEQGLSDEEIAKIEKTESRTIGNWRNIRKLPMNPSSTEKRRLAMYDKGMTAKEIAKAENINVSGICEWFRTRKIKIK